MKKMKALDAADKMDSKNGKTYLVYHWTDAPCDPGPNDYHVVSMSDYHCDPSIAWLPEYAVVYSTCEGWY